MICSERSCWRATSSRTRAGSTGAVPPRSAVSRRAMGVSGVSSVGAVIMAIWGYMARGPAVSSQTPVNGTAPPGAR